MDHVFAFIGLGGPYLSERDLRFSLDVPVEKRKITRDNIVLSLEFPPSVNNLFANGSRGRFTTPAYKAWQDRCEAVILSMKPGRISGPVRLSLVYEDKPRRRDLDNLLKPAIDILVKHKIIDGDHRNIVREIRASWGQNRGVTITIESLTMLQRAA